MNMASGSTMTMSMPSTTAMATSSMTSSVTGMASSIGSSSTAAAMAMDMGGSSTASASTSMSTDMSMHSYMSTNYHDYPVIFKTLKASNGGGAFGIFCILFFAAFFFRFLAFLGAYIEQRVFIDTTIKVDQDEVRGESPAGTKCCGDDIVSLDKSEDTASTPHVYRSTMAKFFHFTPQSLYRDFIRLILAFVSTMVGYVLMLGVMTFVVPYFFAVILGASFGEVFFLRLSNAIGIRPGGTFCVSLH